MKNIYSLLMIVVILNCNNLFAQTKQLPVEEFKLRNGLEVKMIKFGDHTGSNNQLLHKRWKENRNSRTAIIIIHYIRSTFIR